MAKRKECSWRVLDNSGSMSERPCRERRGLVLRAIHGVEQWRCFRHDPERNGSRRTARPLALDVTNCAKRPEASHSPEDFYFLGALAADLLRLVWDHNPDLVTAIWTPFALGETEDGDLGVWRVGAEDQPALHIFGDHEDRFEDAIAWIVANRDSETEVRRLGAREGR